MGEDCQCLDAQQPGLLISPYQLDILCFPNNGSVLTMWAPSIVTRHCDHAM
jgi:hypothetical protein